MATLDDLEQRLGSLEGAASASVSAAHMDRLAPPAEPMVGYSPFDIATLIATGVVTYPSLASALFATPAVVLGTAAAQGVAQTILRTDATLVAFDVAVPTTSAVADAAAVGVAAVAARRDHRHGREAFGSPVAIAVANADGAATTLARANHAHAHGAIAADGSTTDHTGTLSANARLVVRKNTGADVGTRRRLNLIEGVGVTLTVTDDAGSEEIDVTIASSGVATQVSRDATAAAADYVARIRLGTDTTYRAFLGLSASDEGSLEFGPGNAARDTNLYRSAANVLKTDDAFVATSFTVGAYPAANTAQLDGGSLELRSANPFIDFSLTTEDFGARIIYDLANTDELAFAGAAKYTFDNVIQADGHVSIGQRMRHTGVISPAQIVADTTDYNPANLATAGVLRINSDAARNLSGIAAGTAGDFLLLINTGAFTITLIHDATSTAANRFIVPSSANVSLSVNSSVLLWYDGTSARWRLLYRSS